MQYILSQEEMDDRVYKSEVYFRDQALAVARMLLLKAEKYTCWREGKTGPNRRHGYCDDCPCSFLKVDMSVSNLLCKLSKEYSK